MPREAMLALTADWHQQRGAWKRAGTPRGDADFAMRQLYEICCSRGVDLLGAGDLFDELHPDTETLQGAFRFLDDMKRASRRTIFTQGQHEKAYPPYLGLHPHAEHCHRKVLRVRGLDVYGIDHVSAERLPVEIAEIPTSDVLMVHQVWRDFMGTGWEGELSALLKPGGANVILTGDYHVHQTLDLQGTTVLSPGSTCIQSIDERPEKAVFLLHDDMSITSVPLATRPIFSFRISTPQELEAFLAGVDAVCEPDPRIPEPIRKPILSVRCAPIEQAHTRIPRAVGDRAFLFWQWEVPAAADTTYAQSEADARLDEGLLGCLSLTTPEGGAVYRSTARLLATQQPVAEELALMEAEFRPE